MTQRCCSSSAHCRLRRVASGWVLLATTHSFSLNSGTTCMSSPGSTSDRRRIANSMSRLRRRSSSSVSRSSTTDRKMPGCASTSRLMATGRKGMAGIGTVPTRRLPWAPLDSSVRSCAARRSSSKMATARGAKLRPCTVGSTPWATRSKSLKPSVSSSPAMALVTAGCDRCSTAAALRKLRCSSTATNTRNSLIFRCRGRRWIRLVGRHADRSMVDALHGARDSRASATLIIALSVSGIAPGGMAARTRCYIALRSTESRAGRAQGIAAANAVETRSLSRAR